MHQWFQNGPHIQNNKVLKICYICVRVQTLENKFAFNLGLISQEMLISFIFKFKIIYLFIYRMFIFLRINWLTYLCSLSFQYYIRSINKWLQYTYMRAFDTYPFHFYILRYLRMHILSQFFVTTFYCNFEEIVQILYCINEHWIHIIPKKSYFLFFSFCICVVLSILMK